MEGGIRAWEGLTAAGAPDSGMAYFGGATRPDELIALAWVLEEGSRKFYSEVSVLLGDHEARQLFTDLAAAEEHHKEALSRLYRERSGRAPGPGFPGELLPAGASTPETSINDLMEGGMRISDALSWAKGSDAGGILELAISLETNSYDLYLKMGREAADEESKKVFTALYTEEKGHLSRLAGLLDKKF
ncbi:MAG: ferritin family protein [Nitrospirota bacterium]